MSPRAWSVSAALLVAASASVGHAAGQGYAAGRVQGPGGTTELTPDQVRRVDGWLRSHAAWRTNLATPPADSTEVTLDAPNRKGAAVIQLWTDGTRPGWARAVLLQRPQGHPAGIQTVPATDMATLLDALGTTSHPGG